MLQFYFNFIKHAKVNTFDGFYFFVSYYIRLFFVLLFRCSACVLMFGGDPSRQRGRAIRFLCWRCFFAGGFHVCGRSTRHAACGLLRSCARPSASGAGPVCCLLCWRPGPLRASVRMPACARALAGTLGVLARASPLLLTPLRSREIKKGWSVTEKTKKENSNLRSPWYG